ncbi:unnamed protein product [Adineta ricciae]|uniref:HAT C-terminal dimerisation domain-containing protein n=1 Tax=Adineta ricciae TaxID=249248 RepID=A0A815ISY1_ADIRI|nr:unnamed protein product [Adineta ricciae]CAF1372423.1 unnamed protein product [Adineta ricciae]
MNSYRNALRISSSSSNEESTPTIDLIEYSNEDAGNTLSANRMFFNSERIKNLLLNERQKYRVIENKTPSKAEWWRCFGFPAKLNNSNIFERIPGFISCFNCMHTQAYSSTSGTKRFKEHADKCSPKSNLAAMSSITTNSSSANSDASLFNLDLPSLRLSSPSSTLNQTEYQHSKKINENDIKGIKRLCVEWVCGSIRPFSIIDDDGLRKLVQECIRLGCIYGTIDVNHVFRGEQTLSRNVFTIADDLRRRVKEIISFPLQQHSLTICPNYWTDNYKKMSYLTATITFIDNEYTYESIDLFSQPFEFKKKTPESTLAAFYKNLEPFGILSLHNVNMICDCGSNFICAFNSLSPVFCFGHRLNDILKVSFFQSKKKRSNDTNSVPNEVVIGSRNTTQSLRTGTLTNESSSDDDDDDYDNESEDNYFLVKTAFPVDQRKSTKEKSMKNISLRSPAQSPTTKITVDQTPTCATRVLSTLNQCRRIMKYIKKVGIDYEKEEMGDRTVVRWLSMSDLLGRFLKSFPATKRFLLAQKNQALMNDLDERTIKQLILVLKPFEHIMTVIQTDKRPSLYMVLLCSITLKEALSSYKSLLEYKKNYCNKENNNRDIDNTDEDEEFELEGITWFRERILDLLNDLLILDVRHYCATMLHPKYRSLRGCSNEERFQCQQYIRQQLQIFRNASPKTVVEYPTEHTTKRLKIGTDLFSRFVAESSSDVETYTDAASGYESDECSMQTKKLDELDKYLAMQINKSALTENPLDFWKSHSETFPLLSKVAKQIHSIPAISTGVERQFSSAESVINQRRLNINPEQADNILLIRSLLKLN